MPNLHSRIKQHRKKLGLSQADMADRCGVSQPTIANWERGGHVPRKDALEKIADCLGVDSVWLLSGELPAGRSPVYQHLNTPIRHIPIYESTPSAKSFANAKPTRYLSLAIELEDLFALDSVDHKEFARDSILIFDRQAKPAANARFLVQNGDKISLIDGAELENPGFVLIGRLIYSIHSH
ncbi:helix-turn-helix domain-containing protein [Litorimonas haliclonae]|uniref:helix-turn-helix domain-containing protein n=1 Tax=Litorimonas haliclonae TaxID=2081977 RepID=UPI0039EFB204